MTRLENISFLATFSNTKDPNTPNSTNQCVGSLVLLCLCLTASYLAKTLENNFMNTFTMLNAEAKMLKIFDVVL